MAIQRGLFGPISGRIGDKIYFVRNGVSYIRSLPKKSSKPPTENQLIHRAKFSLIMGFLFPIISVLNESYRLINPKKTGTKMAFNQIYRDAIAGEFPDFEIDYPKAALIRGSLTPAHARMTYVAGSNELDFIWSATQNYDCSSDILWPMIYCNDLNEFWYDLNLNIQRGEEFCTISIPENFLGHEIQVWLAYRSASGRTFSNSKYIGHVLTHSSKRHEII